MIKVEDKLETRNKLTPEMKEFMKKLALLMNEYGAELLINSSDTEGLEIFLNEEYDLKKQKVTRKSCSVIWKDQYGIDYESARQMVQRISRGRGRPRKGA